MTLDRDTLVQVANAVAHAIADVLEGREAKEPPPPSKPAKKVTRKRAPAPVRPEREPSELDRARARAALRRAGYLVKP